ncbi:hypothetical protein VKT23_017924 [Stygiomarasmius scandens]|uniref:Uncharacterized protein n=1 Tax=Marasmiellus scandens TaxID=2682957 RepID=A0ABR1IQP9_9AGAR
MPDESTLFIPKKPVPELSLAVRKDIHDKYETVKDGLEDYVSHLLGFTFTFSLNPNEIWAYNIRLKSSAGEVLERYVTGFVRSLKTYLDKHGKEGKENFNATVTAHKLSLSVNPLGDKAPTISCEIRNGVFVILFHYKRLGDHTERLDVSGVIKNCRHQMLSAKAKSSIEQFYDSKVEEVVGIMRKILGMPDLELEPSFEANFKKMKAARGADTSWQQHFGQKTIDSFESFKNSLVCHGFKKNDQLRQTLNSKLTAKKIILEVVNKSGMREGSEVLIKDGALYLRTTPYWWNCHYLLVDKGFIRFLETNGKDATVRDRPARQKAIYTNWKNR